MMKIKRKKDDEIWFDSHHPIPFAYDDELFALNRIGIVDNEIIVESHMYEKDEDEMYVHPDGFAEKLVTMLKSGDYSVDMEVVDTTSSSEHAYIIKLIYKGGKDENS